MLVAGPAVHEVVEPVGAGSAADGDEGDGLFIARLEADGGGGGDVQAHAVGGVAVEFQRAVHFEEMEVGTHLNGTVARVVDLEGDGLAAFVELNRIGAQNKAADGRFRGVGSVVGHEEIPL